MIDRRFSIMEISEYLGFSKVSAFKWIKTEDMSALGMGKNLKFKPIEINI